MLLAFFDPKERYLLWPFVRDGFHHVTAYIESGDGWIEFDGMRHKTRVRFIDYPAWNLLNDATVIKVKVIQRDNKRRATFGMMTCVGQLKALLGIRKRFIITPYQLYKYLRNEHGTGKNH